MKKDKATLVTLGVFAVILIFVAWYTFSRGGVTDEVSEAERVNIFSTQALLLTDFEGNPVSMSDYEGKVVVANSWATWCPFCKDELAAFAELKEQYESRGVAVLAINRAETRNQIVAYQRVLRVDENLTILLDETDSFYRFIGGFSMPETVFYDREGNPAYHKRGPLTLEEMQQQLESILE